MEMRLAVNFSAYQERFLKLFAARQSGKHEMYCLCYDSHSRVSASSWKTRMFLICLDNT